MKRMWSEEEILSLKKDISTLVDSKGNPRFVEGEGVGLTQEGVTISYCKWSLSGTHLMLVCAGNVANNTSLTGGSALANFTLPDYISNKIVPTFYDFINRIGVSFWGADYSVQNLQMNLVKSTNHLKIMPAIAYTLTADRSFRIQFDVLIDSE